MSNLKKTLRSIALGIGLSIPLLAGSYGIYILTDRYMDQNEPTVVSTIELEKEEEVTVAEVLEPEVIEEAPIVEEIIQPPAYQNNNNGVTDQSLENILNADEAIVNKSVYQFKRSNYDGTTDTIEKEVYSFGSAVGVYKNVDEELLMYLTCEHVIAVPETVFSFRGFSRQNGFYRGNITIEGGKEIEVMIPYDINDPRDAAGNLNLGVGTLVSQDIGLYQGEFKDAEGNIENYDYIKLRTLASNEDNDIALLKVKEDEYIDFDDFDVWERGWAVHDVVRPGDYVYAVGHPLFLGKQITSGEITATDNYTEEKHDNIYFISANINPGNSGGANYVVDNDGELLLVGLSKLKWRGAPGICGIVTIEKIRDFLTDEGYSYIMKKEEQNGNN